MIRGTGLAGWAVALTLAAVGSAAAGCFDRSLAISRYAIATPTGSSAIYQDIYRLDPRPTGANHETRLSSGALASSPYDNFGASWAPDGSGLVFLSGRTGRTEMFFMLAMDGDGDGEGDGLVALGLADEELGSPHWRADGTLTFIRGDAIGNGQVHTAGIAGTPPILSNITARTSGGHFKLNARVSGDGQQVGFAEEYFVGPNRRFALASLRLADARQVRLSAPDLIETELDWIPGTGRIVFASNRDDPGQLDLYAADVEMDATPPLANLQRLTDTPDRSETGPRISPDGNCLAYLVNDATVPNGPNDDLHIRDLTTGEDRRITRSRDVSGVAWKP